ESEGVPPASCGDTYSFPLVARNGAEPYSWSSASGSLPAGVTLSSTGMLTGSPTEEGFFSFRVRVEDAAFHAAERDYTLRIGDAGSGVEILTAPTAECATALSIAGSFATYHWLPGDETTPSIGVSPSNPTTYGVIVTDGAGCTLRGSKVVSNALVAVSAGTGGAICSGDTLRLFASGPPGAIYSWTGPGGFRSTAQNPSIPAATPAQSGTYTVTATFGSCDSEPATTVAVVGTSPVPTPVISAAATVCPGSAENVATASDAGAGATYVWSISNGTITSTDGRSVNFTAGDSGAVRLSVVVTTAAGCSGSGSAEIAIEPCPTSLYTITPCRLLDTRVFQAAFTAGETRTFGAAGLCDIPLGVKAIAMNVTVTGPSAPGDLRVFPGFGDPPLASVVHYRTGQTRASSVVLRTTPPYGWFSILCDQASGTVDVILDISGYFQ
ncbi:MAG: putative Ig domain-containing protein, partial [Thermoanaerobaculia bacterium]